MHDAANVGTRCTTSRDKPAARHSPLAFRARVFGAVEAKSGTMKLRKPPRLFSIQGPPIKSANTLSLLSHLRETRCRGGCWKAQAAPLSPVSKPRREIWLAVAAGLLRFCSAVHHAEEKTLPSHCFLPQNQAYGYSPLKFSHGHLYSYFRPFLCS